MSSPLRNMQRRNLRAKDPVTARKLRGQTRGRLLGVTNPRAAKPLSGSGYGSRRGTNKRAFQTRRAIVIMVADVPYRAPSRAARMLDHKYKMARKGYRARPE